MRKRAITIGLVLTAVAVAGVGNATAAEAATTKYANCTAVHKVYSGGIAKTSVTYNTVHHTNGSVEHRKLKGTVKKDNALYSANSKLDADKDGIACEAD
ncbi:calcium-binding protein [Curtobacterium sp. MCBD17_034]|uniref:excalibur calcium-binding domain-containing protein n=1 Tax=unclassified Curtobacterium TaxID=257496 RepID=UPI000DA74120|nr:MULTISPECIES: excalibur calcium-binding domain-containing protein [unclassified Curtobacterium]PZF57183.1 calcium-binding protein [Curtobacterium sp. MCBD17_034]PZM33467.1 calcium-binding protein [Curtobacterium sp. MCBD17_031]